MPEAETTAAATTTTAVPAVAQTASAAALLGDPASTTAAATAPATTAAPAIAMPGKDATPEVWSKFYDDIGAPKTADAYEIPTQDGVDPAFAKAAAGWMAEARLTPDQAKVMVGKWNASIAEQKATSTAQASAKESERIAALNARNAADEAALKNAWGANHDAEMGNAARGATQFLKPIAGDKSADVIVAIENVIGYGATIKFLHSIGKGLGEASARGLGSTPGQPSKSAADTLYPSTATK